MIRLKAQSIMDKTLIFKDKFLFLIKTTIIFSFVFLIFSKVAKCQVMQNDNNVYDSIYICYFSNSVFVEMIFNKDTLCLKEPPYYFVENTKSYKLNYDSLYNIVQDIVQTFVINKEDIIIEDSHDIIGDFPKLTINAYKNGDLFFSEWITFSPDKVFNPKMLELRDKMKNLFLRPKFNKQMQ